MDNNSLKDLDDLTRSVLYEETPNRNLIRLTALVIGASFLLFLIWASIVEVNEVTQASGEIMPSGYAQVVQHLEGGIVSEILVEEGELVEQGQTLLRMGGTGAEQDFVALSNRQNSLLLQAERLRALAFDQEPDFSSITGGDEDAIAYQNRLLESARQSYEGELSILKDQVAQKSKAVEALQAQRNAVKAELNSATELLGMKQTLEKKGSASRKDVIDSERDVARLQGEIQSIDAQISEARDAISEFQNRQQTLTVQNQEEALNELEDIENQIAENRERLTKQEARVGRMEIKAPVRGLVKGLKVNTIGGVVTAGEPLMEIVPLDQTLIVEAQIAPREIGNLRVGQPARIKVTAYDFSRYGVIDGTLEFLSATTFMNDDGGSFYKARISMDKSYVGPDETKNLILPGMTVEADIITGKKTILAYLLKPIHTSLDTAFRER